MSPQPLSDKPLNRPALPPLSERPLGNSYDYKAQVAARLQVDQIEYLNAQTPSILIAQLCLWAANVFVLWGEMSLAPIGAFTAVIVAYCIFRLFIYYRVKKLGASLINYQFWSISTTLASIYAGLFWGAVTIYIIHFFDFEKAAFSLFATFGLVGGSIATISFDLRMLFGFCVPAMLPTAIFMLLQTSTQYDIYAFVFLGVTAITYPLGKRFHKLFIETSRTQFDVDELMQRSQLANSSKAEFLANMSHELRSPLSVLLGYIQIMKQRSTDDGHRLSDKQQTSLNIVEKSGKQIAEFVSDVLELSVAEAAQQEPDLNRLDFATMMYELETAFMPGATGKGLKFNVNLDAQVPWEFIGDRTRLRQALMNLVDNAVKFTTTGSINVDARLVDRLDNTKTKMPITPECLFLRISIKDTGSGIPDSEKDLLFIPFSQTSSGRQGRKGTGLGLALSQKYVELMGGVIRVDSEAGKGSEFYFTIPVYAVSSQIARHAQPVYTWDLVKPCRVLIVDDDPQQLEFLAGYLTDHGFDVRCAEGGGQAIQLWAEFSPDLILLDLRMPDISGEQVAKHIRNQETNRQANEFGVTDTELCQIIAVSAHGRRAESRRLYFLGINAFLEKPFSQDNILETIHSIAPDTLQKRYETPTQANTPPKTSVRLVDISSNQKT